MKTSHPFVAVLALLAGVLLGSPIAHAQRQPRPTRIYKPIKLHASYRTVPLAGSSNIEMAVLAPKDQTSAVYLSRSIGGFAGPSTTGYSRISLDRRFEPREFDHTAYGPSIVVRRIGGEVIQLMTPRPGVDAPVLLRKVRAGRETYAADSSYAVVSL